MILKNRATAPFLKVAREGTEGGSPLNRGAFTSKIHPSNMKRAKRVNSADDPLERGSKNRRHVSESEDTPSLTQHGERRE